MMERSSVEYSYILQDRMDQDLPLETPLVALLTSEENKSSLLSMELLLVLEIMTTFDVETEIE